MTVFDFIANGTLHQIELPYLVDVETARKWMQTLDYPSPERTKAVEEKRKEESARWTEQANKKQAEQRQKAFEKAEKLTTFNGSVYDDDSDQWFSGVGKLSGIGELLEYYESEGNDPPAWVWASKPAPFRQISVEDIVGVWVDDSYEDCWERIQAEHPDAIHDLNQALTKFVDTIQHLAGDQVDYSRVVLINAEKK